jgi:pentapeptide MXKDX repeat protein
MAAMGRRRSRAAIVFWLIVIVMIIGGAVVWSIGPIRPLGVHVSLLVLGADGVFGGEVRLEPEPDTGDALRLPLVIAIRNEGTRRVRPLLVHLSIPARFRLIDANGRPLDAEPGDGGPLVRYTFTTTGEDVEAGAFPVVVAGSERIRLEFLRGAMSCRLENGVPMFAPSPPYPPELLARVEAFWSIETAGRAGRQTGPVTITFDPAHIGPVRPRSASFGPIAVQRPGVSLPRIPIVAFAGVRDTECGEPGRAEPLQSFTWATENGRLLILAYRGAPRMLLFDLNGDDRVELETWDIDGDGHYEARREVSFPLPPSLLPLPTDSLPPAALDSLRQDSIRRDSLGRDSVRAALRQDSVRRDSVRRDSIRRDSVRQDSIRRDSLRQDSIRRDSIRRDTVRRDTMRTDTTRSAPIRRDTLQ